MKKEQILVVGIGGCLLSVAGIVLTVVYFAMQREAARTVLAEPVQLAVCVLDSKEEYSKEQITGLLPGQSAGRETAVILDADSPDAYIRVHIHFGGILGEPEEESEEEKAERLTRIRELKEGICFCEGWMEGEDGSYYYQREVFPGSIIPIYQQIVIPENWDNSIAEKIFTVELSAEAVRSDCLEPWFEGENGEWNIVRWD